MAAPTITLDVGPEPDAGAAHDADPFGLEPELRRRVLPAARFLYERYWRVEVTGVHHLPAAGPALVVANHSGALPFDGAMKVRVESVLATPVSGSAASLLEASWVPVEMKTLR